MMKFRIIILLLLVAACKPPTENTIPPEPVTSDTFSLISNLKDGELTLSVNDKSQTLKEEGNIVDFYTSEDKKSIVLEIEMFSTLSILKIYKWNLSSERYEADKTNINKIAWEHFDKKQSIKPEELESSYVYFLEWKGQDSLVAELRGNTGMSELISDTIVLKY